jgi:hypothetical protein
MSRRDCVAVISIFCLSLFMTAIDDSYEDSQLSAQVLDEAIAQAQSQKEINHILVAHKD